MHCQIKCSAIAVLVGALPVLLLAQAQSPPESANGQAVGAGDYIQAKAKGQFSKPAGARGEHTGFQIKANALTWEVDVSANDQLRQTAERLVGKLAIATGIYAEHRGVSRVRRVLTVQTLESGAEKGRREYIDVTVHGTLRTSVMAIGAETTGVTITAGAVTWELELDGKQHQLASKLSGTKAIISGQLRQQAAVEVRNRSIVKVRSIE